MTQFDWKELIVHNPMLIEITRFRRRYFTFTGANSVGGVVLGLILICYATLVLIVVENRNSISPIALITFQTGLLCLFAPMTLYQSIAGERERRSWDLLLAAPITKSQIVVGKFMGAIAALGIAVGMLQVPVLIAASSYEKSDWRNVVMADAVSVTFLMCVCSLTLLFSARVKRGLMALGATLGSLMTVLVVIPSIIGVGSSDRHGSDVSLFLHPFYVLNRIGEVDEYYSRARLMSPSGATVLSYGSSPSDSYVQAFWWGWPQAFTYLGLAIVLLGWAANTLNFAENEVKFLPQGHKDA